MGNVVVVDLEAGGAELLDRRGEEAGVEGGLNALAQVLAHPDPIVVSTFFVGRGAPGPVEVHTDVARVGRRLSTGTARLFQSGTELVRTTASYADLGWSQGMTSLSNQMPDLPEPEDAVDPFEDFQLPGVTMTDQVEFRYPALPRWRQGPSGNPSAEFGMRFTAGRDARARHLPMLVDAAAPVVLELAGATSSTTLELTSHVRGQPAPGWLACRVTTRHVTGGYHEEDFEIWDSQGQARRTSPPARPSGHRLTGRGAGAGR